MRFLQGRAISTGRLASLAASYLVVCKQRTEMQSYFTTSVSQDYFVYSFSNVSHYLSLIAIDHIVGILYETQYVRRTYFSSILSLLYY